MNEKNIVHGKRKSTAQGTVQVPLGVRNVKSKRVDLAGAVAKKGSAAATAAAEKMQIGLSSLFTTRTTRGVAGAGISKLSAGEHAERTSALQWAAEGRDSYFFDLPAVGDDGLIDQDPHAPVQWLVDAHSEGSVARLLNHSCDGGNVHVKRVFVECSTVPRLCFFASVRRCLHE